VPAIDSFRRRLYASYKQSLTLPVGYKYLYGNPVQPAVPLDVARDGVMVIGAYPSARFATLSGESDVPVADHCAPFSGEIYFDGARVRSVASGVELEQAYLRPLGLSRSQCWITDLVRVFLFTEGHIAKYRRLGCPWPARETRSQFEQYARQGLGWLVEELEMAQPRLVLTLGAEVAGVLQGVRGLAARNALLGGDVKELWLGDAGYPVIHLAHPGIVMRPATEANPWPRRHREEHLPRAREMVELLVSGSC
jgi:uracil-DNA glycosylase